jgi:hypothetical protein
VRPSLENGKRLTDALRAFGFDTAQLTPEMFSQPKRNIQLGHPLNGYSFTFAENDCNAYTMGSEGEWHG